MDYPLYLRKHPGSYSRVQRDGLKIIWARSQGDKCIIVFEDGETLEYSYRLKKLDDYLSPSGLFIRVHESHYVRKDAINDCGYEFAILQNDKKIPVSRKANQTVKKIVNNNSKNTPRRAMPAGRQAA